MKKQGPFWADFPTKTAVIGGAVIGAVHGVNVVGVLGMALSMLATVAAVAMARFFDRHVPKGQIPVIWFARIIWEKAVGHDHGSRPWPIRLLKAFSWLLPRERRDEMIIIIDDLGRDHREMRREGRSGGFIRGVLAWHGLRIIVRYLWDGMICVVLKAAPFLKAIGRIN